MAEEDYGTLKELQKKIETFERAPARERKDGLTITEQEAAQIKPLVESQVEHDEYFSSHRRNR